jgi:hypothetical protein
MLAWLIPYMLQQLCVKTHGCSSISCGLREQRVLQLALHSPAGAQPAGSLLAGPHAAVAWFCM